MQTSPRTLRPVEAPSVKETKKAQDEQRVAAAHATRTSLSSLEGRKHLEKLCEDGLAIINALRPDMTEAELRQKVANLDYIRACFVTWGVEINMGEAAMKRLAEATIKPALDGSAL